MATAGVIVHAKEHRLGWTVFTHLQDRQDRKEEEIAIGRRNGFLAVLALNVAAKKWGVHELRDILRLVKTKEDGPMPKSKKDLWAMYQNLQSRSESYELRTGCRSKCRFKSGSRSR